MANTVSAAKRQTLTKSVLRIGILGPHKPWDEALEKRLKSWLKKACGAQEVSIIWLDSIPVGEVTDAEQ